MRYLIGLCLIVATAIPARAEIPDDPLRSSMWNQLAKQFFADAPIVFDDRVKVTVPSITENQAQVPVAVDARALDGVQKVFVFADLNPIQHVLELTPTRAEPYIAFRMKVEQSTPVRAAALTADGTWHVGGIFLNAAGGGCTAPAMARSDVSWYDTLGQAQGRLWRQDNGTVRARFRVRHPMDTGLAKDNTPAYYIEHAELKSSAGDVLAELKMFEPVSEDPTLTLDVKLPATESFLDISGRDNNGRLYSARIAAPWKQSQADATSAKCSAAAPC